MEVERGAGMSNESSASEKGREAWRSSSSPSSESEKDVNSRGRFVEEVKAAEEAEEDDETNGAKSSSKSAFAFPVAAELAPPRGIDGKNDDGNSVLRGM